MKTYTKVNKAKLLSKPGTSNVKGFQTYIFGSHTLSHHLMSVIENQNNSGSFDNKVDVGSLDVGKYSRPGSGELFVSERS